MLYTSASDAATIDLGGRAVRFLAAWASDTASVQHVVVIRACSARASGAGQITGTAVSEDISLHAHTSDTAAVVFRERDTGRYLDQVNLF